MTASEASHIGFAIQTAKGTPNVTDASFKYVLIKEGGLAINNINLPLDMEVGGGSMLRNIIKAGVVGGGAFAFIPRPATLGMLLKAALGKDVVTGDGTTVPYSHVFTHATDPFSAFWYTGRQDVGGLWGEQYPDMRLAGLTLSWRGGRFMEGQAAFLGAGAPSKVAMTTWTPDTYVDGGPQFIAPLGVIELPTATAIPVTAGSFTAAINMPLDEQWTVGSYSPNDLAITQRAYVLNLLVKIPDGTLANKINFDPAGGSAWLASMMKEALFNIGFSTQENALLAIPYNLVIAANGQTQASGKANVAWTARPISLRAGKQIVMSVTGTFLASDPAYQPITVTLKNMTATY